MGKTAIAVEAVYRFRDQIKNRFPDGVIFHSFYREPATDKALEQIARFFNEDIRPSPAAAAQRALSRRLVLLILDGAEKADDLKKIVEVTANCGVLITSQRRQDAVLLRQDLEFLSSEHSRELLKAWGVPVYKLLGGPARERIRLYTHVGIYDPDKMVEDAQRDVADGFTAVKTGSWQGDYLLPDARRTLRGRTRGPADRNTGPHPRRTRA